MVAFTVYGKPQPQGSSSGFIVGRSGGKLGVSITSNNKALKPWRQQVSQMALITLVEAGLTRPYAEKHVAVEVEYTFWVERPPSIPKKRTEMVVKPDIDKLVRGCTDALTGFLFADDAQVVKVTARKLYGSPSRTEIVVKKAGE